MKNKNTKILVRSSWQTINIGDIGHTPGLLAILEKYIPESEIWLWPGNVENGVEEMLRQRFPKVRFVQTDKEVDLAHEECDFLLHGSGPYLVAKKQLPRWIETGKPFGVDGITLPPEHATDDVIDLLNQAAFVYFRDSVSLNLARERGVHCPVMAFGPDGAFAVDLRNDPPAEKFLQDHGLEEGKFLCCIGRFRKTPDWMIPWVNRPYNPANDQRNQALKEQDHAPLREAICRIVRETELKVLLCPEDATQMAINREMLWDPLPDDVRKRVVWRESYWLTNEALSTYVLSAGLFGHEMHSPIMCVGNGIPAIVVRWAEQTSKGYMWQDIGLGDWFFDFDKENDRKRFPNAVLAWAKDLPNAQAKTSTAQELVISHQQKMMDQLRSSISL